MWLIFVLSTINMAAFVFVVPVGLLCDGVQWRNFLTYFNEFYIPGKIVIFNKFYNGCEYTE